jgi:hypothetical protein
MDHVKTLREGRGVPANREAAEKLFKQFANKGDGKMEMTNSAMQKHYTTAMELGKKHYRSGTVFQIGRKCWSQRGAASLWPSASKRNWRCEKFK